MIALENPVIPATKCAGCGIIIRYSYIVDRWVVKDDWGISSEHWQRCPSNTHEFHWPLKETNR